MTTTRHAIFARAVNLAVPGGGLVLIGRVVLGTIGAAVFAVFANLALWGVLLIPDDMPGWLAGLAIGIAGGAYVGAQLRLSGELRREADARRAARRREILTRVVQKMEAGDDPAALHEIRALSELLETDLLVAFRFAQLLTRTHDADAPGAWLRVRRLDRHHIYRGVSETGERPSAADADSR